ncbi:hypothetical protein RAMLITH_23780 [Ramlibacter sp. RBP-2]|uniref:3-hydroxyacyl-CoA dehydrogenase n=1 Tax=Ramlibacter lithotrophicus TaxID=2606681 RepID=A0A7X6DKH5_9BURK|nr:3-hydroxyacyl-CoA dehydrogenase [Ramlibacter lithotrophicus]NKE68847.1 hypothetical protein [Ramlibacter lithotrophicus]
MIPTSTIPRASENTDALTSAAKQYLTAAERLSARRDPNSEPERIVAAVGIVGAGTMGSGIALCFALGGYGVTMMDANADALKRGQDNLARTAQSLVKRGRLDEAKAAAVLARITGSTALDDLATCDLVIEAAFEDLAIKQHLAGRLGQLCKPGAIIATNTSTLDVNVLAQASGRPADFLGMHFFSPAHAMRLLEVVRGSATAPAVLNTVMGIAERIGKVAVVSGVCYGFIGNRMLEGYLRETEAMLLEGATPEAIDNAIESVGLAMGPCRMIDLAGVDVAAKVVLARQKSGQGCKDPAYRGVVRELFALGHNGQKSGRGYYRYEGRTPVADPDLVALCERLAAENGLKRRSAIPVQEIIERALLPLVNEGACIAEEGIAARVGDVDLVWVHGYGFPAALGGPMYWGERIGAKQVVARLEHWATTLGNPYGHWDVSPWLRDRANQGTALIA